MFEEGGVPVRDGDGGPPTHDYDPDAARALADRFSFDVVGPQLA
jgi:hypothetical protein